MYYVFYLFLLFVIGDNDKYFCRFSSILYPMTQQCRDCNVRCSSGPVQEVLPQKTVRPCTNEVGRLPDGRKFPPEPPIDEGDRPVEAQARRNCTGFDAGGH